ncbi:conserved hypothetical protein [Perkinsus marinus ATCC 50983]|uniref:Uncharacterized protein n=1 Tax=Perkinsus marinus (strain ATCC 50983 / TXsc) TaxID=423536 RepID=C5KJ91_PERM5|nr:conserved hypothetical protein [Perkinsus marinus ATCC 50983]EER15393.1 conserved hypothetical protein [Perkinsus marinus ATCC 50983]|eukprot:XP_002783597.1 conserved hypothetical protein [Perkinsus marinus ATCC 50983]
MSDSASNSSSLSTLTKVFIGAGVAAVAGVGLYYLFREEGGQESTTPPHKATTTSTTSKSTKVDIDKISKAQVLEIMKAILASQDEMKQTMKVLTRDLADAQAKGDDEAMQFQNVYNKVQAVQPKDPLETYGLSMMEFDQLLDREQNDPQIRECIVEIMGGKIPEGGPQPTKQLSVKQIISIHEFMLQQLDRIVTEFSAMPESVRAKFDMKTVTIAAQAIVGSAVENKFSVSSDDIESAVMLNHAQLSVSQQFANINIKMQETMTKLMDQAMGGSTSQ